MLIHVIGIYGRDLDTLLLRFKDESFTGSVFQIVSFSGTVIATSPAKFFSAFYILLQEPSCLIVFFSENWRRHAFLKSLFRFHFVTVKGITKIITRSWAMSNLVIANVLACKHQLEQSHMMQIPFSFSRLRNVIRDQFRYIHGLNYS